MILDAHQHYWDPARGDYSWLTPDSPLYRTWMPEDLHATREGAGVEATLLVQAAPTVAETDWLLALAAAEPSVVGVVGWVDLDATDVADRLSELHARGLIGIRPMLQDLPDPDWILGDARDGGLRALSEAELAFDALVHAGGLPAILALADRHPTLRIVLDHGGKPPLGDTQGMTQWEALLRQLAERPNTFCKLSGLLTQLPPGADTVLVRDAIARLVEIWTPARLIWGSDWPVLTLAGSYSEWLSLTQQELGGLTEEEMKLVFGANARAVYRL